MKRVTRATLYLGANIGGEPGVTDKAFKFFLKTYVSPRFSGFTVRNALGYWENQPEGSWELVILSGDLGLAEGDASFKSKIEAIAQDYKVAFKQEAVMISYELVGMELV